MKQEICRDGVRVGRGGSGMENSDQVNALQKKKVSVTFGDTGQSVIKGKCSWMVQREEKPDYLILSYSLGKVGKVKEKNSLDKLSTVFPSLNLFLMCPLQNSNISALLLLLYQLASRRPLQIVPEGLYLSTLYT